jgi:polyphosphate kinase 2 (PPK2 family)
MSRGDPILDQLRVTPVFPAMDAAGKDSAIEHVMSGVSPQGVQVFAFQKPVALRVHPAWLDEQRLPGSPADPGFSEERFEDINAFERHLDRTGTTIVKFFLHVSRAEQKRRFTARLDEPHREWKFNAADVAERARWGEYMAAYEDALTATATPWAPWYVVPADHKGITHPVASVHQ